MKSLTLVNAALVLSLSLPVSAMPYEAAAAGVGVAPAQFAILHALLGWRGGSSPTYSFYRAKDEPLLLKSGITVRPIEDATERAMLENELMKVRRDHNNGRRNLYNKSSFITPEKMVERHRGLIEKYADRITVGSASADGKTAALPPGTGNRTRELFAAQDGLMARLTPAMKALADSKNQAAFEANLRAFNDAAAGFGDGSTVTRRAGESFASVVDRARAVYASQSLKLQRLAVDSGSTAAVLAGLESLKGRGAFFDGANGEKVPLVAAGSFGSTRDPNSAAGSSSGSLTADKVSVPAPAGGSKGGPTPGLFGMLGSLLGGLFRTLGRVASALLHGVIGVGKALLS